LDHCAEVEKLDEKSEICLGAYSVGSISIGLISLLSGYKEICFMDAHLQVSTHFHDFRQNAQSERGIFDSADHRLKVKWSQVLWL